MGALAGLMGGGGLSSSTSDSGAATSGVTNTIGGVNIGKGAGQTITSPASSPIVMIAAGAAVFILLLLFMDSRRAR